MGMPVVVSTNGRGLPVTVSTNGFGTPCTLATNGLGVPVVQSTIGAGLAVTGITFGPTLALTGTSVLETAAVATTVGTVSISGTFTGTPTYTLTDSAGGKFALTGATLKTNALLDYETATFHSVTVSVSGVTPSVSSQAFIILVIDVAEPVLALTGTTVNENAAVGVNIGTLSIVNSYTGTPVYSLVDSASGKVAISGALLNVGGAIDYETTPTFNITVAVSGITPAAVNKVFTVVVSDVAESASATWNPSDKDSRMSLSGGNLIATTAAGSFARSTVRATASASSGKYYSEHTIVEDNAFASFMSVGVEQSTKSLSEGVGDGGGTGGASVGLCGDGSVYDYTGGPPIATIAMPFVEGDTIGMAVDLTNHRIWFRKNGGNWNSSGTANPATNTGGIVLNALMDGMALFPAISHLSYTDTAQSSTSNFAATPPSGFSNWGGGSTVVTKNIVTDYGAVGDAQWARATLSITTNTLTSATAIWPGVAGDYVGKAIVVGKCGGSAAEAGGGTPLRTTITGRPDASTLTLADNCISTLSAEPNVIVAWGTPCNTAFDNFRTAWQGLAVTLTIPAGNYLISAGNFGPIGAGIRNLTINASGATLCGGLFQLGSYAQYTNNGHSGYTASATAGATFVTLLAPADVSKFTVGNYAMMSGFGLQAGGYPSNHQRFEYLRITALDSDSGSPTYGRITFLTPLANAYLSTWPLYFGETPGQLTSGGPATLYAMDPKFDHTTAINNLTVAHHPQMGVSGLNVTLNNCVFESIWGPHATMSKSIVFNNCLGILSSMEVDKIVSSVTFNGCDWTSLSFQSTCITDCILDNTDIRQSIVGTPWKITIRNGSTVGTISGIGVLVPGSGYGYSNELIVSDSAVNGFGAAGTHESGYVIPGADGSNSGVNVDYPTMSGGVITIPSSKIDYAFIYTCLWPVTDGRAFIVDGTDGFKLGSFKITDVVRSGGNVLVSTTKSGGWPSRSGHKLYLVLHPAPICTFTNVTGCPEVVDLSQATAAGLPLYSYSKRTYNGSVAIMDYWQVWGRVKKIVVIVTQAYTGAFGGAVTLALGIQASNLLVKMSDYANTTWAPVIDLKKTGTRTFDATAGTYPVSSWSSTAVAAADTLPGMTEALWAPGNFRPSMTDVSGEAAGLRPIFSVEVITDQGLV